MTAKRNTWQKDAVTRSLRASEAFVSAQELHQTLRLEGSSIGLATVYRALAELETVGEADSIQSGSGETLYRACGDGHHHHLVCTDCGVSIEVEAPQLESWANDTAASNGFVLRDHRVELFGICPECQKRHTEKPN
jgi:Fur family ferric uptake transcriptional regulator